METSLEIQSTIQDQLIESILKKYIQKNNVSVVDSKTVTEFESELKKLDTSSKNILWKRPQDIYVFLSTYPDNFICGIIPLAGLKIMGSVNSKFDISLLGLYFDALSCLLQLGPDDQNKKVLNISDIIDSIEFLLEKPEIQQQIDNLPEGTGFDHEIFTREKLFELLLLCREIGGKKGEEIFQQHASKIQFTEVLFLDVLSWRFERPYQECIQKLLVNNSPELLTKMIDAVLRKYMSVDKETQDKTLDIFKRNLKTIAHYCQDIPWKKSQNGSFYFYESINGVLPLAGLKAMNKFKGKFDISLLLSYYDAFNCVFINFNNQNNEISNIEDIMGSIEFLLEKPEIQQQIDKLPKTVTGVYVPLELFTQEKLSELLLLCREIGAKKGEEIFQQHASKIQFTEVLFLDVLSWRFERPYQECIQKLLVNNSPELLTKMIDAILKKHMLIDKDAQNKTLDIFKRNLKTITTYCKDIQWKKPQDSNCSFFNKSIYGVLSLAGLMAMNEFKGKFDISLLQLYYDAFHCVFTSYLDDQNQEISNIEDIMGSIEFLLEKPEIQQQIDNLPGAKEIYSPDNLFTQEKLSELLLLCQEIGKEKGKGIFERFKSKIKVTDFLLGAVFLWPFETQFLAEHAQEFNGNVPEGTIGLLVYEYTRKLSNFYLSGSMAEEELKQKEQLLYAQFEKKLEILPSITKTMVCTDEEFDCPVSTMTNSEGHYLTGIPPLKMVQLMQEKFKIQVNPALLRSLITQYFNYIISPMLEPDMSPEIITNEEDLVESICYLMQNEEEVQKAIDSLTTIEEVGEGLAVLLCLPNVPQKFYPSLCEKTTSILKKTSPAEQEYVVNAILEIANVNENIEVIEHFSKNPHIKISPRFLKVCAETNNYDGLACLLKNRPEFLNTLPISNHMLNRLNAFQNNIMGLFEKRLKEELQKNNFDNNKEIPEILSTLKNDEIYVPDMVEAVISVSKITKLMKLSIQDAIDFEFGTALSIFERKEISHPDEQDTTNSESVFGSWYGYKPNLYEYAISKLNLMLSTTNLDINKKQFCFKLAVLFPNEQELQLYFDQLLNKVDTNKNIHQIIHNESDFKIPTKGYWDIDAWFSFVKRHKFNKKSMTILRSASDLDMQMCLGNTIFPIFYKKHKDKNPLQKIGGFVLDKLKKIYKKNPERIWNVLINQCPLAYEFLIQTLLPKETESLRKQHKELGVEKLQELAKESIEKKFSKKKNTYAYIIPLIGKMLDIYNLRETKSTLPLLLKLRFQTLQTLTVFPEEYREALLTALEYGYSNDDIKEMIEYLNKNKSSFTFVPSVQVDGAEVVDTEGKTYGKYVLALLEKTDPMAIVSGLKTQCCQHFNGPGKTCAMHAYNSIYGAIYRLAPKVDPNKGDWIAQAWTVLSECGTILSFDSIEISLGIKEEVIVDFFKKAAEKLLRNNPALKEIRVGHSEFSRIALEKFGYSSVLTDQNFSIGGYSKHGYSESKNYVVLITRDQLTVKPEKMLKSEIKPNETLVTSEYQIRYGIDTYITPGKPKKTLGLSDKGRQLLNSKHYAAVVELLKEDPKNPLVEEGFVSSDDKQKVRYHVGEYFLTYNACKIWVEQVLNPKLNDSKLAHQVYVCKDNNISDSLIAAQKNTDIKTFSIITFIGIHAVSIFIDPINKVGFSIDSEPGHDLKNLIMACKQTFPDLHMLTPDPKLRLQKDYYSCVPFAVKSTRFYAKNASLFSKLLLENSNDSILQTTKIPAQLLKMSQIPLELTEEQQNTVVSAKKGLTFLQYQKKYAFMDGKRPLNSAALKTHVKMIEQLNDKLSVKK